MKPEQRIVTRLPLRELWTAHGPIAAERGRALGASDLVAMLHERPVLKGSSFVVANLGHPLQWLDGGEFLAFWKEEARGRIVEPEQERFYLDDFPDAYCFTVYEWRDRESGAPIVVFERHD